MNLQTELAPRHKSGLLLRNPVMTAAGTFGYGIEYAKIAEAQRLGAVITRGTTLHSHSSNVPPRTIETASGLLNAIGYQNSGVHSVVKKYAPTWATWQTPVIVNIAGETIEELVAIAEQLEGVEGIAGIEISVSNTDMRAGGAVFSASEEAIADVMVALRRATTLPLIVKLSPDGNDVRSIALAAASSGADAISLINTIAGMRIDTRTRRPFLPYGTGGLSGPAIKPIALRMVYEVARELRAIHPHVPVIGIGGIANTEDALEFLMAGASAIQVGTITFVNPRAAIEIVEGLEVFMRQEGIEDVREIVGGAQS